MKRKMSISEKKQDVPEDVPGKSGLRPQSSVLQDTPTFFISDLPPDQ